MSVSVERLRRLLLAGVGLLALVIAAFLGYGRYLAHHLLSTLPPKLGINITQETNAFTYSQSDGSRTIYTLHAAKSFQHKDGKYLLQDVGIVLYGKKQDRADRIYGKEFEYDPQNGVIHALGEVHIDLAAPTPQGAKAQRDFAAGGSNNADAAHESHDPRMIHVTTSGLIYLQKLGVAATDQPLEFEFHGLTGHATGADFNTDSGELLLHSAVQMSGIEQGQPVLLTANSADLDRQNERVLLQHANYRITAKDGMRAVQADKATVHLRADGTAERVEAEGNVTLSNDNGGTMTAPRGEMTLNANNQPQTAKMTGGVKLVEDDPQRQMHGDAADANLAFDKGGHPQHVVMIGSVHLVERQRASAAASAPKTLVGKKAVADRKPKAISIAWNERDLATDKLDLSLSEAAKGEKGAQGATELRDAKATGSARLKTTAIAAGNRSATAQDPSSVMSGDVLTAHFATHDRATEIETLHGEGRTAVRRVSDLGAVDTSSGDVLDVTFHSATPQATKATAAKVTAGKSTASPRQAQTIASAVQVGHVIMTHKAPPKPGVAAPAEQQATGQRSVYDGDTERLTITGTVQLTEPGGVLWADRMVMEQQSGDVAVDGSVKASYRQSATSDPVHILAARGDIKHDSGISFFYGTPGSPARMWQGGSQVDAPVLRFDQKQRSLLARGDGQGTVGAVHTTLVNAAQPKNGTQNIASLKKPEPVRVVSSELNYSDTTHKAEFTGGVDVTRVDGTMRAQQATLFLRQPAQTAATSQATPGQNGFMGGQVERMVADGHVEMNQPGRKATGEQLIYTAADGLYVLTGTSTVAPLIHDEAQGTTTGCALRFRAGDNSVVVSNEGCSGRDQKVRSETQVKDSKR